MLCGMNKNILWIFNSCICLFWPKYINIPSVLIECGSSYELTSHKSCNIIVIKLLHYNRITFVLRTALKLFYYISVFIFTLTSYDLLTVS